MDDLLDWWALKFRASGNANSDLIAINVTAYSDREIVDAYKQKIRDSMLICSKLQGQLDQLKDEHRKINERISEINKLSSIYEKAMEVFQLSSESARQQAKKQIENMVTDALQSVFGDDLEFTVSLFNKANKPHAEFNIKSQYGGVEIETPVLNSRGGGIVDVVAFALRVLVAVATSSPDAPIILDEPSKHLSENYSLAFGELLQTISRETGRQIIVVTHNRQLAEKGDIIYNIELVDGVSKVEKVSGQRGVAQLVE